MAREIFGTKAKEVSMEGTVAAKEWALLFRTTEDEKLLANALLAMAKDLVV